MPIYYRADSRSPAEIFKDGFSPREKPKLGEKLWWAEAIRAPHYQDHLGGFSQTVDADSNIAITLSSNLESAALFPLNEEEETYIYAIALPEASKIFYIDNRGDHIPSNIPQYDNGTVKVIVDVADKKNYRNPENLVIDLHSLQTMQAANSARVHEDKDEKNLAAVVGWPLYVYEALVLKVACESIVAAVKIKRSNMKEKEISTSFRTVSYYTTDFKGIESYDNPNFSDKNYSEEALDARQKFKEILKGEVLHSPDLYYGLGGKTLPLTFALPREKRAGEDEGDPGKSPKRNKPHPK